MSEDIQTRRCPLWVKIVLAVSLAGNLAVVGLVAGAALRGGPFVERGPSMGYAMPYVVALPREARREVFGAVRTNDDLPDRRARRALEATPFDIAAVEAVLERQGAGAARVQATAQAAWLDVVARLSDDERIAYTARIEETLKRRGPPRKPKQ
jgi:hypothetical protein